jgi:hypothetical protein
MMEHRIGNAGSLSIIVLKARIDEIKGQEDRDAVCRKGQAEEDTQDRNPVSLGMGRGKMCGKSADRARNSEEA